jgi:D-proline reductase (dithiol) PrdB
VGLIQSVVERSGIPTVSITVLREITERVAPPRALFVDRPLGYPLGAPNDRVVQRRLIVSALSLLESEEERPFVKEHSDG